MECRAYGICLDSQSRGYLGKDRKVSSAAGGNLSRMHKTEETAKESRLNFMYSHLRNRTLDVAKRLARILDGTDDIKVVLTRTGDYFVPLPWRTAIANREVGHRAVFVSIHFNAGWRQGAYGIETYYNNSRGYRLAALIHPRVIQAMDSIDRGIRHRGYFVLRRNRLPAVLVECGFLTNPAEASRITDSGYRERIARAIAAGIVRYD